MTRFKIIISVTLWNFQTESNREKELESDLDLEVVRF